MAIVGFTGFETGSTLELSTVGTGASVQLTVAASGVYALLAGTTDSVIPTAIVTAKGIVRFRFRKSANPTLGAKAGFFRDSAGTLLVGFGISTLGMLELRNGANAVTFTGTTILANDVWHDIALFRSSAIGEADTIYLNGAVEVASGTRTTSNATVPAQFAPSAPSEVSFYFDDFVFENTATLPPSAKVVKAQGKTGTPVYNAFTKTGAASADLCWSNTPFNAATNCNSATSSAAQTMLTESVTAKTGADATIHGARVALVAKSSSVTKTDGAANIRRRVGGVDTNTAITLTTADALYQTPIFTETLANLDISEIGFAKGVNISTHTVEDVWLMVAFVPSAAPPPPPPPPPPATTNFGGMFFGAA